MPKAIPFRTYEDYDFLEGIGDLTGPIFAVKLAEPITYPPLPKSIQFSSTPNEHVTKAILETEIAKPPTPPREYNRSFHCSTPFEYFKCPDPFRCFDLPVS